MARVAPAVLLVGLVLLGCGPRTPSVPAPDGDPSGPTPLHPTLNPGPAFVLEPLESFVLPPVQTSFQTYELIIPQAALDLFEADPFAPEQPATFVHDGQRLPVDVRLRGASARAFPKKSWNVDFNDLRFEGREELNLVSEYPDSTLMVEKLAWDMLEAMRVPAPRSKYVRLVVNGQYQGVFLDIEEVDTKFTRARRFPDPAPNIYRCGFWNCEMKPGTSPWQGDWQKKSNKAEPRDDLDALVQLINFTPEPEFASKLEQTLELEGFLRMMAVEVLVSMNLIEDSEGYYVHDRVTGR